MKKGNARICGGRSCVVSKAEPIPITVAPFVEKALVAAIPRRFRGYEMVELFEFVLSRGEDEDT
jgi:hypothetical protein